jgi:hypothetical protein
MFYLFIYLFYGAVDQTQSLTHARLHLQTPYILNNLYITYTI